MQKHQSRLRALHLLPLISFLQVPWASAFPFSTSYQSSSTPPGAGQPLKRLRPPPLFRSVNSIDYTTLPSPTTYTDNRWPSTIPVYEIGDGQIQAPYVVSTKEETSSSSSSVATLASRNEQPPPTSTSTTTVFVVASRSNIFFTSSEATTAPASPDTATPENSPGGVTQSFTTTIPHESLTSLTTSEVQTVAGPPPSDTSGVSIPPSSIICAVKTRARLRRAATAMKRSMKQWYRSYGLLRRALCVGQVDLGARSFSNAISG